MRQPCTMYSDKKSARLAAKEKINGLTEEYLHISDGGIFENFISLPEYRAAGTIFIYYSVGREPDTHRIICSALKSGKTVALPYSLPGGMMEIREIKSPDCLVPDSCGIPSPPDDAGKLPVSQAELAVIPALAFDRRCRRIGHGGGYYDRFLEKFAGFSVGLSRDALMDFEFPVEGHDRSVDCVITEKEIARR